MYWKPSNCSLLTESKSQSPSKCLQDPMPPPRNTQTAYPLKIPPPLWPHLQPSFTPLVKVTALVFFKHLLPQDLCTYCSLYPVLFLKELHGSLYFFNSFRSLLKSHLSREAFIDCSVYIHCSSYAPSLFFIALTPSDVLCTYGFVFLCSSLLHDSKKRIFFCSLLFPQFL